MLTGTYRSHQWPVASVRELSPAVPLELAAKDEYAGECRPSSKYGYAAKKEEKIWIWLLLHGLRTSKGCQDLEEFRLVLRSDVFEATRRSVICTRKA